MWYSADGIIKGCLTSAHHRPSHFVLRQAPNVMPVHAFMNFYAFCDLRRKLTWEIELEISAACL